MRLRSVYTLVGGDTRQAHVAQMLAAAGFTVHTAGVPGLCGTDACLHDAVRAADTVVLPMPAFAGGAQNLINVIGDMVMVAIEDSKEKKAAAENA